MAKVHHLTPYSGLENPEEKNIALIKLNTPIHGGDTIFETLWSKAVLTAVVDGAVNELYRLPDKHRFTPDLISGDFDSANPEALEYYRQKGVPIIPTPDQDETDFVKCLRIVCSKLGKTKNKIKAIYVHVSFVDGRFDHVMANMNALFLAREMTDLPVTLVGTHSMAFLLSPGHNTVNTDSVWRGSSCGLIPLDGVCKSVTTTGFKYDMDHRRCKFGELVSTSNSFLDRIVTVETDNFMLFTIEMNGSEICVANGN